MAFCCIDSFAASRLNFMPSAAGLAHLGEHAHLQGGQRLADVAVGHLGQEAQRRVVRLHVELAQAPLAGRFTARRSSCEDVLAATGSNRNTVLREISGPLMEK